MERSDKGVRGRDRNGNVFAIFYVQVDRILPKPYGCAVQLVTGELIKLNMGYNRANQFFRPTPIEE